MKNCKYCHLTIVNEINRCPLCRSLLAEINGNAAGEHPGECADDYPSAMPVSKRTFYQKLWLFVLIAVACITVTINHMMSTDFLWSLIAIAAVVYVGASIFSAATPHRNPGLVIFVQVISLSLFLLLVDFLTGYSKWSLSYAIPFIILGGAIAVTVITALYPMDYREFFVYQLALAVMSGLNVLLIVFNLSTVTWPWLVSCFYCVLSFVAALLFSDKKTRHELKKRFHF
jgi:hypothetical protein